MSPKRKRKQTPREQPPRKIRLTDHFAADADYWAGHDPAVHRKLLRIVSATVSDPFRGIGKPEPLKHDLQGLWSRRLTRADRVVYDVTAEFVTFLSARHHYPRQG
ncbi:MAG TPA: Txe/YoeB family addiction module toxin [Longimicrobium sp.]|nr:Txe/YoeB family addiction module toxin [Longimicrobium sp.]